MQALAPGRWRPSYATGSRGSRPIRGVCLLDVTQPFIGKLSNDGESIYLMLVYVKSAITVCAY